MRVGHSRQCLTPQYEEFYLLGYKNPNRNNPAKGVHDDIYSNALLFENDGICTFVWSADLLELPDTIAKQIKDQLSEKYGIDRNQIILGVMHNHSSVRDFHDNWEFGKFSQEYYDFFLNSIVVSYQECLDTLQTCTAKYGRDLITGYYSNRNHEGELADNEVIVVNFYDENENAFAAIVNWAVHSTAMGASNMYLTGDLAGNTARKLGEKLGYYPLFLNGDAADCSNRHDRQGTDFDELEREASGLCEAISNIVVDTPLELNTGKYVISHQVIDTDMDVYCTQLKEKLQEIESGSFESAGGMPNSHLMNKIHEQLELNAYHDELDTEVLDLGELRFYVFPGELSSGLGKILKQSSPDQLVMIAGYSNGFHYYFFHEEDYGCSFETIGNPVPKGMPEKIIAKMIEDGKELRKN